MKATSNLLVCFGALLLNHQTWGVVRYLLRLRRLLFSESINRHHIVHFAISPRLCAFLGGVVAQEVIKKTGKCSLLIRVADPETISVSHRRILLTLLGRVRRYTPIEQWVHHVCCSDVEATAFLTLQPRWNPFSSSHNYGPVQHN